MASLSKIIGVTRKPALSETDQSLIVEQSGGGVDADSLGNADMPSIPLTAAPQENEEALMLSETDAAQQWSPNPSASWSQNFEDEDATLEFSPEASWKNYIVPALFSTLMLAWTGFFLWTMRANLLSVPNGTLAIEMIGAWSLPASLIGILWILALRNSHSEAKRFSATALSLREEGIALQERVRNVNEEIAIARDFLTLHGKDLETVGRLSSTRMIEAANLLARALHDSEEKAKALEVVSSAATGNLEQLRKHLPVVTSAAKDVTNQIGNAGNAAQVQVKSLIAALQRVAVAGGEVRENIGDIDTRAESLAEKLSNKVAKAALSLSQSTEMAAAKGTEIAGSFDEMTKKMVSSVSSSSALIESMIDKGQRKLAEQHENLQSGVALLANAANEQDERVSQIVGKLQHKIEQCSAKIAEMDAMATDRASTLAFSLETLAVSSHDLNGSLAKNSQEVENLLATSERLLLALDTSSREIEETLPAALVRIDAHFERNLELLSAAREQTQVVEDHGAKMLTQSEKLFRSATENRSQLESLLADSDTQFLLRLDQAEKLATNLRETQDMLADIANGASNELVKALQSVQHETQQAADTSKHILETELATLSGKLTQQSSNALTEAVQAQVSDLNIMMQDAIRKNITASEATIQDMLDKLHQIETMTNNLESRISQSRESFEGLDDDGFSRRMALLTESLNSTAIDVAKILSNEVTDTSWASYLKGDRGVFTRRAVKLLDAGEARAIATHYGEDPEFREHVNRYIHDFESMMRVLLSTRDGNAIGVTLLSSDVGKLYVALAQAIERLRS